MSTTDLSLSEVTSLLSGEPVQVLLLDNLLATYGSPTIESRLLYLPLSACCLCVGTAWHETSEGEDFATLKFSRATKEPTDKRSIWTFIDKRAIAVVRYFATVLD